MKYSTVDSLKRPPEGVSFIIPAHNEAQTIASVVRACVQSAVYLGVASEVMVVDDNSMDCTGEIAEAEGARLLRRDGHPSKAGALNDGVLASAFEYVYFVDGDCRDLTPSILNTIAKPVLDRDAAMSVGVFDYGRMSGVVSRYPWSSGQRVLSRSLFPLNDHRLAGYNVELLINERVGLVGGRTFSSVMRGVTQPTKQEKDRNVGGVKSNIDMWRQIARTVPKLDENAYRDYMENVVAIDSNGELSRTPAIFQQLGFIALRRLAMVI